MSVANEYDVIVIGGGPAGYVSAIRAAQLGMRVALVEKRATLGGTCLNIGCIPSKALLDSSERYYTAHHDSAQHGIRFTKLQFDLKAFMRRKEQVVRKLVGGVSALMKANKITVIEGAACLSGAGAVEVNGQQFRTAHIVLASGSVPQEIPSCPIDGTHIVTSEEALSFTRVPKRLLVVGAGAIGLELGSVWQRVGSEVIVCELQSEILPAMDKYVGKALRRILAQQGMQFMCNARIKSAEVVDNQCRARINLADGQEQTIKCDNILVAVGRRPYTEGLGLDTAGVAVDAQGFVNVDERYQTTVKGVYAIGDLVRRGPMLAHKAEEEGVAVAELIAGRAGHVNYATIPNIVYTMPEVAVVGKSEQELKAAKTAYRTGQFPFSINGRALAMNANVGFVRIFSDTKSDRVLGAQLVGAHVSDLIAELVLLTEFGGSAEDLARTVHAHPTLTEAIREAALDVEKRALHTI